MKKSKKSISNRLKKLRMLILSLIFLLISIIPIFSYSSISFERTYGDTLSDVGYSVQQTLDGGYIITGCIDCRRQPMPIGIYLVKTDSFGDTIWTKTFGRFTDSEYRGCSIQ